MYDEMFEIQKLRCKESENDYRISKQFNIMTLWFVRSLLSNSLIHEAIVFSSLIVTEIPFQILNSTRLTGRDCWWLPFFPINSLREKKKSNSNTHKSNGIICIKCKYFRLFISDKMLLFSVFFEFSAFFASFFFFAPFSNIHLYRPV